ncbi:MAG: hypothetical protein AAGA42_19025 [Actinomycetota bacterium]
MNRPGGVTPLETPANTSPPTHDVDGASARRQSRRNAVILIGVCALLAALSLLLPGALSFDPSAWVIWGREVGRLELDTVTGPSWKPLPVVVTTIAAPFGDAAPELWMWVARTGGLLAMAGVVRLGMRLAGPAAGALAGALLILTPDGEPRFIRTWAEGHDAPATAALAVWAIDRHLAGRRTTTVGLLVALALLRPEAWPFVLVYAAWLAVTTDVSRVALGASLVAIPVLWFGGDLWGAGNALQGASAAQVIPLDLVDRTTTALGNVGAMVIVPAWVGAGLAVVLAIRRRDPVPPVLAALALAWCVIVSAMAIVFGYAALSRFLLPAAAVMCVLAGAGYVRAVSTVRASRVRVALAVGLIAVSAPFVVARAAGLPAVWDEVRFHDDIEQDLHATIDVIGFDPATTSCAKIAVEPTSQLQPATAWKLDVPLRDVRFVPETGEVFFLVIANGEAEAELLADPAIDALGGVGTIAAYARSCRPEGAE